MSSHLGGQYWPKLGPKEKTTYETNHKWLIFKWAHLDLNQGPSDYESDALTV